MKKFNDFLFQVIVRLVSYFIIATLFFILKNLLQDLVFKISSQDFKSIIYVVAILIGIDFLLGYFFYRISMFNSFFLYQIVLVLFLLIVSWIGVRIDLISSILLLLISVFAWGLSLIVRRFFLK